MAKNKRKKFQKKIKKSLTILNFFVILFSVSVGFLIVHISGTVQEKKYSKGKYSELEYSALRLADAFEIYNKKRFAE